MRRYMEMGARRLARLHGTRRGRARGHILYAIIVFARRRKYGHGNGDRQVEERFLGKKIGVEKGNGGRKDGGGGERWIIARIELFHEQKTDPSLRVIG